MTLTHAQQRLTQSTARLNSSKNEPGMQAMVEVLELKLELAKDKLVTTYGEGVARLQGEALAYKRLLAYINDPKSYRDE